MYVCICNAVTDTQIRAAAEDGATDLWRLQAELGVAAGCGSCREAASEILAEHRAGVNRDLRFEPQVYVPAIA